MGKSSYIKKQWDILHQWKCSQCGTVNSAELQQCHNCNKWVSDQDADIVPQDTSSTSEHARNVTSNPSPPFVAELNQEIKENYIFLTKKAENLLETYEKELKEPIQKQVKHWSEPSWICKECNQRNPKTYTECIQCNTTKNYKKPSTVPVLPSSDDGNHIYPSKHLPSEPESYQASTNHVFVDQTLPSDRMPTRNGGYREPGFVEVVKTKSLLPIKYLNSSKTKKFFGILTFTNLLVYLIVYLFSYLFAWHPGVGKVTKTHWVWHVELKQRNIVHAHDWRTSEPNHIFNESCTSQIRSYSPCHPYECNPHQVSYRCNCSTTRICTTVPSCHTSCSRSGRRRSRCVEICSDNRVCVPITNCSTCYRTAYDTCWNQCPNYDLMCNFDYPIWHQVNSFTATGDDHSVHRPLVLSHNNNIKCPLDPESLFLDNPQITQCTIDSIQYSVEMEIPRRTTPYHVTPSSLEEYNRYTVGTSWNLLYNHVGMVRLLQSTSYQQP